MVVGVIVSGMANEFEILHHGAVNGVTGSCHELRVDDVGVLVDCGLFQGAEVSPSGREREQLTIDFDIAHIKALVVTHVHIDHVGRLPYLLAAGFKGPIICSEASAVLLPLVLEDAIKIGFTRDRRLIDKFIAYVKNNTIAVPYGQWHTLIDTPAIAVRLKPAGHILGSAYVECRVGKGASSAIAIFSGDLGAPYSPLLPAPKSPWRADTLLLESTYGDKDHQGRRQRRESLRKVVEQALADRGTVLIPAFSIGRTQELLYELEEIIHRYGDGWASQGLHWSDVEIIVDSPLASRFTEVYKQLKPFWDKEARRRVRSGRHPLSFEQLTTIDSHEDHINAVEYLADSGRPAIVLAASGMCAGGRVVNYLKAMLGDKRHNVMFVGYQAQGTPGRDIQKYGPRGDYVEIDGKRYVIKAGVHTISGYSAHAGQTDLVNFIKRMRHKPKEVRLIHGDDEAKFALKDVIDSKGWDIRVVIT